MDKPKKNIYEAWAGSVGSMALVFLLAQHQSLVQPFAQSFAQSFVLTALLSMWIIVLIGIKLRGMTR